MTRRTGAHLLCDTLEALGVELVFGLPGTQNVPLFEALRGSPLRMIVATHELGAGFMANGYARTSGRPGILVTIPGPGFTYALTALAEARHDSAAMVLITLAPERGDRSFLLQAIDQRAVAAPLVKASWEATRVEELAPAMVAAYAAARDGEPGPVLLEVRAEVLHAETDLAAAQAASPSSSGDAPRLAAECLAEALATARRPAFFVGQGASGAAESLRRVVEDRGGPLLTTLSGRGALAEDHPLCLAVDLGTGVDAVNGLLDRADLVVALGCKFSHNGSGGFRLRLARDRLIHVDASPAVAGVNYPARAALVADVPATLRELAARLPLAAPQAEWTAEEIASARQAGRLAATRGAPEPAILGRSGGPAALFAAIGRAVPRETILVTDSGLHQMLARRHWSVRSPRGLLAPSDFQSMGFGIPAAIGARLAAPDRPVLVVTGDGGFNMAGLELLTAAREEIPVVVLVFHDGEYGLIRQQQLGDYGHPFGVALRTPEYGAFAEAIGVPFALLGDGLDAVLTAAFARAGPTLVEVALGDSPRFQAWKAQRVARATARRLLPEMIKSFLRPRRS